MFALTSFLTTSDLASSATHYSMDNCSLSTGGFLLEKRGMEMCCIFWPEFGCYALQTLVKICCIVFHTKKLNNGRKSQKIRARLSKMVCLKFASKQWSKVFLPNRNAEPYKRRGELGMLGSCSQLFR